MEMENRRPELNLDNLNALANTARLHQESVAAFGNALSKMLDQIEMPKLPNGFIEAVQENQKRMAQMVIPAIKAQEMLANAFKNITIPSGFVFPREEVYFEPAPQAKKPEAEEIDRDQIETELRKLIEAEYNLKYGLPKNNSTCDISDLKPTTDGGFEYNDRYLKNMSLDQKECRLLLLFLQNKTHFLKDDHVLKELNIADVRNYQFVIRDLKDRLKANGFIAIIKRRRQNKGYVFLKLKETKKRKNMVKK